MKKLLYLIFTGLLLIFSNTLLAQCPSLGSITLTTGSTSNTCAGNGSITAQVNNPTGISLQLLKSGTIISQVPSNSSLPLTNPYTWNNLQPGNDYSVRAICSDDQSIIYKTNYVTVVDNYNPITDANISISNTCTNFTKGGTFTINSITGGTAPYSYSIHLSNDPNYDDALSTYGTNNSINVSDFGTYQIRIKDACGNYKTFTKTISPAYEAVKLFWYSSKVCGSNNVNASFWWANSDPSNQPLSDVEVANMGGVKIKIYEQKSDGTVNPQGPILYNGTFISGIFTFPVAPSHKYYIETINACGQESKYVFDKSFDEVNDFSLSSNSSGCGVNEKMTITGNIPQYWTYPINVAVKNTSNVTVYSTTLHSNSSAWTTTALNLANYNVTYTDNCGVSLTKTVNDPRTAGPVSISIQDYPKWHCNDVPPLNQDGTIQVIIAINGYLTDRQNAVVKIVSGPTNVGVQANMVDGVYWGWTNMLNGNYVISVESCGVTNTYPLNVNVFAGDLLTQSLTSIGNSFCSGGGNITSTKTYTGSYTNNVELYNISNLSTPIATSFTGDFYNLAPGNYFTKIKITDWCGNTYYVDGNSVTLTNSSTGPNITSSVGVICEDVLGNPLTTGSAYLTLAGVTPYTVQYKLNGSSTWTTINNAPNNLQIDNLQANSVYDILFTDGCGGTYNTSVSIRTMGALTTENTVHPCYNSPYVLSMRYYAGATYQWINPQGVVVSNTRTYSIPNYTSTNDGIYTARIAWGNCVTRYIEININGNLCGTPIETVYVDAQNDINQTPINISISGNALTNDSTSDNSALTIKNATYLDSTGNSVPLLLSTLTSIYDNSLALAGTMILNNDGTYTYNPSNNYFGNVPIGYKAGNSSGYEDTATITIKVIPENNNSINFKPIAQNDTGSTESNTSLSSTILSNDKDPENNTLIVISSTIPLGIATTVSGIDFSGNIVVNAGKLTINSNGTYTFIPATSFSGYINSVTYTISDGNGGTDSANLTFTVLKDLGNDTFANDDANSAPKGITMTGNIITNDFDPEGNTQTVTVAHAFDGTPIILESPTLISGKGTLTLNTDGSYTFIPLSNFIGTLPIIYSICDNGSMQSCDTATLYLTSYVKLFCYKPAQTTGTTLDTNHGITALGRAGADNSNWPMVRKGAWTILEAKTKGFVVNRLTDAQISAIPAAQLVEGMMVYNITQDCLQINVDGTATGWKCFNTQACPD